MLLAGDDVGGGVWWGVGAFWEFGLEPTLPVICNKLVNMGFCVTLL